MKNNTFTEIQTSRDLLTRHLLLTAEADERGLKTVAVAANKVWKLHDVTLAALEQFLRESAR